MVHHNPLFRCYFGNSKDQLEPEKYLALTREQDILLYTPFSALKKQLQLERLLFLKQIHSANGFVCSDKKTASSTHSFIHEGDYIITNQKKCGIGIMSADCLPLIIVDIVHQVVGIAHAGWRGTASGVSLAMLAAMRTQFETNPLHVKVFFGPCAQRCCYEVQPSFKEAFAHIDQSSLLTELRLTQASAAFFIEKGDRLYFDTIACNRFMLQQAGIPETAFCFDYNRCTICTPTFCSHRRGDTTRQMTVVALV